MKTLKMIRNIGVTLCTALLFCGLPAQARYDGLSWQAKAGVIGYEESNLSKQLYHDFKAGLIDTNELSMMVRDLDGIREKEDARRMNHGGLCLKDEEHILDQLEQFQTNLDHAVADKVCAVVVNQ